MQGLWLRILIIGIALWSKKRNLMKICVVHRYPPSLLKTSDISFPIFVSKLIERGHKVYFLGFKESSAISCLEGVCYKPMNLTFNRVKKLDRNLKSILFVLI